MVINIGKVNNKTNVYNRGQLMCENVLLEKEVGEEYNL